MVTTAEGGKVRKVITNTMTTTTDERKQKNRREKNKNHIANYNMRKKQT